MRSLVVCFALVCGYAHAGVLPETHRGELIRMVLDNFWGKAKLPGGQFVQPASEQERITVPISRAAAHRTIDAWIELSFSCRTSLTWSRSVHRLNAIVRTTSPSGASEIPNGRRRRGTRPGTTTRQTEEGSNSLGCAGSIRRLGPIVDDSARLLMYLPLAADGFALRISSTTTR